MPQLEEYKTMLDDLAKIVAQMTSGIKDAVPEEADYEISRDAILFIEARIREG